ncbi:polysaccharide biosynthesis protein GumN [Sphingomonas sp. Leaf33]|uniref:TraB/GumN family protein n=1 Tax=Sphingomonas sp. Leaf33 TaxID=1736215 RepID=UPI0007004DD1|nr:TraB/GumN family protein [Sphingomonas sp. Leaf33]KQN25623.1 polysaccharide biosynthesis protein GumN [Sphingomonas sp. Leaf33]
MNRLMKTSLSTAALFLALPACAQQAPAPAPAAKDADPALWVVKDADTTIYLFGTVHVLKPGLTWFDEAVKTAFDGSKELVLEMVEPDAATMQKIVLTKATQPAGTTLTASLPEPTRGKYVKAMGDLGLPATAFDTYKPWFAAVNLSLIPLMKAGYDPNSGAEKTLTQAANAAGKTVSGLETAEQQIGFFDALSPKAQTEFLGGTIDEMPKIGQTMETMVTDWSAGAPDKLAATLNESMKDSPEVAKTILYDRNARWATWISERMKQPGTVFVAVGAGHLAGKDSVQDKLGAYKLKAVRVEY